MDITYFENEEDCRPLTESDVMEMKEELARLVEQLVFIRAHIEDTGYTHLWVSAEQDRRYIMKQLAAGRFLPYEEEDMSKHFHLDPPEE